MLAGRSFTCGLAAYRYFCKAISYRGTRGNFSLGETLGEVVRELTSSPWNAAADPARLFLCGTVLGTVNCWECRDSAIGALGVQDEEVIVDEVVAGQDAPIAGLPVGTRVDFNGSPAEVIFSLAYLSAYDKSLYSFVQWERAPVSGVEFEPLLLDDMATQPWHGEKRGLSIQTPGGGFSNVWVVEPSSRGAAKSQASSSIRRKSSLSIEDFVVIRPSAEHAPGEPRVVTVRRSMLAPIRPAIGPAIAADSALAASTRAGDNANAVESPVDSPADSSASTAALSGKRERGESRHLGAAPRRPRRRLNEKKVPKSAKRVPKSVKRVPKSVTPEATARESQGAGAGSCGVDSEEVATRVPTWTEGSSRVVALFVGRGNARGFGSSLELPSTPSLRDLEAAALQCTSLHVAKKAKAQVVAYR